MQNVNSMRVKELQRDLDKCKSFEKIKQTEIDNFKT